MYCEEGDIYYGYIFVIKNHCDKNGKIVKSGIG